MRSAPAESFDGAVSEWIRSRAPLGAPDAALAARIDFDRVDEVLLRVSGIAGLAQRFGADLPVETADWLPWAEPAAATLRTLGRAQLRVLPSPSLSFRFRADGTSP